MLYQLHRPSKIDRRDVLGVTKEVQSALLVVVRCVVKGYMFAAMNDRTHLVELVNLL